MRRRELVTNAMTFTRLVGSGANSLNLTTLTNSFLNVDSTYFGQTIENQRVGANPALTGTNRFNLPSDANALITLGITNQWHFYIISNETSFTNARFLISDPLELAVPRMGVESLFLSNATPAEADIDMYVSTDPTLIDL